MDNGDSDSRGSGARTADASYNEGSVVQGTTMAVEGQGCAGLRQSRCTGDSVVVCA